MDLHGQSCNFNGLDNVQAVVFVGISFKTAFFFLLGSIWRYFTVVLYKNNLCSGWENESPSVDVGWCQICSVLSLAIKKN